MPLLESSTSTEVIVPNALFDQILEATNHGRALDAYQLGLQAGPLDKWSGPDNILLAARLAGHLGGTSLSWRLVNTACRQKGHLARFSTQRIYGLVGKRGLFAAWQVAQRLDQCEFESALEKAESLVCRGILNVSFRDFEKAASDFTEAQGLAPQSPWVWSECSGLWAEQGNHQTAMECVDYALSLQPYFRPAIQRKVQYLQTLQRDEEALQLLESARQHLQFYGIALQLITIYSEQENWNGILPLLEEARLQTPLAEKELKAFFAMKEADARLGLGDLEGALAQAEKVPQVKFYENLAQHLRKASTVGRRVKIPVPYIHQEYNTCAPATLSAITAFWNRPIPQETLIDEICYDGTTDFAERRWGEKNGWYAREFKVTWESAVSLLDLGIPFILTTTEIESGHAQAVIGYDTLRHSLLIRDPNTRHHAEVGYEEFAKHYESVGPRGLLILPPEKAGLVAGLKLPETELYDFHFRINCALDEYDRARAETALQELGEQAPNHRLYWMGRRALANYDQNPVLHLEAVDQLRLLFPEDDRLLQARIFLLRTIGRHELILHELRERFAKPKVPGALWLQYDQELSRDATWSNFAIRLARRSLKHNPQNLGGLGTLATHLWNAYHRDNAVAIQRLAACLGEKNENVAQTYFQMFIGLGRTQEGLDYLQRRATGLLDRSSAATITFVQALDQLNLSQEARETLQAALVQRPHDGDLLLYSAQFEAFAGQTEQGFQLLHSASAHSRRVHWLRSAARLHRRVGDYEQSLQHWNEVAESSPLDLEAHREIALLLARRDGKKSGEDYVQSIGRRFPQHVGILQLEIAWLKEERGDEIEGRLVDFVQANPYNAWAQRELALVQHKRQENENALQRAQFARQIDPYNADSWQVEAVMLESLGREAEAVEYLRYALSLRIDGDFALRRLLSLTETTEKKVEVFHFVREQIEQQKVVGPAINSYRETAFAVLTMDELTGNLRDIWQNRPDRWEAWNALSQQLLASGKFVEAEEIAVDATTRFPLLPNAWYHAGIVQGQQGRWNEAIHSFQRALQLAPEWVAAVHSLADAYRRTNQLPKALELFEHAHRRNSLEATFLGAWADLLWHSGKREEAVQHLQKAVDLSPDYHWGWTTLSHWTVTLSQKDLALEMCRERAQRLQRDARAWLWVAQLAWRPEQAAEQLEATYRARESDPQHVNAHDWVAVALVRQRRFDEATEACRPTVFGTRIPVLLRGREAWVLFQRGQSEQAIEAMNAVLRVDPQYYWGWEMVTDWYLQKNDLTGALHGCEQLIRLAPAAHKGYALRAQIYVKTSKRELAKKDYQRASALAPNVLAAGWQLFQLQLKDQEFLEAEHTINILQLHASPGVILPARMILAASRNKVDDALNLFCEAALLPEIDTSALHEAVTTIDNLGRADALNTKLSSVMKDPALNPVFAAMWVSRRGKAFSWNLVKQFRLLNPQAKVHAVFLERWLLEGRDHNEGFKVVQLIQKNCRDEALKHTIVWGTIGNVLTTLRRYREAAAWLQDWPSRPDVQGWMLTNLVFSLHSLNRRPEADEVSREILKRGLRDHTTSIHLAYLTLTALEEHRTEEARALFNDIYFEGKSIEMKNLIKQAIKSALTIQEALAEERAAVYETQRKALTGIGEGIALAAEYESMKQRAIQIMKADAGKRVSGIKMGNPPAGPVGKRRFGTSVQVGSRRVRIPIGLVFVAISLSISFIGSLSRPVAPLPDTQSFASSTLTLPAASPPLPYAPSSLNSQLSPGTLSQPNLPETQAAPYNSEISGLIQSIRADPNKRDAWSALATNYVQSNHTQAGIARIEDLAEAYPSVEVGWFTVGRLKDIAGDYSGALEAEEKARQLDPKDHELWDAIGLAYSHSNQLDKAADAYRKSLELFPNYDKAWNNLGYTYFLQGNFDKAEDAFKHTLAVNPRYTRAFVNLVRTYVKQGKLDLAQKTCDDLATINSTLAAQTRTEIHP